MKTEHEARSRIRAAIQDEPRAGRSNFDVAVDRLVAAESVLDDLEFTRCPQCGDWLPRSEAVHMLGGHYCEACAGDAM